MLDAAAMILPGGTIRGDSRAAAFGVAVLQDPPLEDAGTGSVSVRRISGFVSDERESKSEKRV